MFSRVRIAIRFFIVGLAVGILLAPRSGEDTRRMVREKADRLLNDILDAATLGTANTGTNNGGGGATRTTPPADTLDAVTDADPDAPKRTRATRTRAASSSS